MKMLRCFSLVFLLFGLSVVTKATTGKEKSASSYTVRIKLIDPTGEEIPGAVVALTNNKQTFISDANGFATIQKNGTITINALGFIPKTLSSNELSNFSEIILTPIN